MLCSTELLEWLVLNHKRSHVFSSLKPEAMDSLICFSPASVKGKTVLLVNPFD